MRRTVSCILLVGAAWMTPAAATAQADDPLVEVCEETVGGPLCTSLTAGQVIAGDLCTTLLLPPESCATLSMNPVVDPALVEMHEASWLARAHALQERLDDDEPLLNSLVIQTHNSNNATFYSPTVTAFDPNQLYSITDQLRMNMRGIELDLHWVPAPTGSIENGLRDVVLCHGRTESVGAFLVHVGCSNDRPLAHGLAELRAWLDDHPDTFLLLYLENQMEDDPVAHAIAAAAIETHLGDLVHRPAEPCQPVDWDTTQRQLIEAGTPVLIAGNCGAGGAWGTWVHERGDLWREGSNTAGYAPYPDCIQQRADPAYDDNFIRTWEDATWLSAITGGGSSITPDEARGMVDCGLDLIGLDRLVPLDSRLEAMVWSWDVDEPSEDTGSCAERQTSGRFRSQDCALERHFACHGPAGWFVPDETGTWFEGFQACEDGGGTFRTPPTGWENRLLGVAGADAIPTWLNYQSLDGGWLNDSHADEVPDPVGEREPMPSTGGGLALGIVMVLVLARRRAESATIPGPGPG